MTSFDYALDPPDQPILGLVVLQADETIEGDFQRLLHPDVRRFISRIPSGDEVTAESLLAMKAALTASAGLFPRAVDFDVVGYGCTSGTAQIGAETVARRVREGTRARAITEPVSALTAACRTLGIKRLALLSPYIASVSERLRAVLLGAGIETPLFGSFDEAEEARVARISSASVIAAATEVAGAGDVDGLFLSCTNLRTLDAVDLLEDQLGMPVLSSNQVLAWHMASLAGARLARPGPGRLLRSQPTPLSA